MRNSFLIWFKKNYPGMDPQGQTASEYWEVWQEGFLGGVMYLLLAIKENQEENTDEKAICD